MIYDRIGIYLRKLLPVFAGMLMIPVILTGFFPPAAQSPVSADDSEDLSTVVLAARGSEVIISGTVLEKISYRDDDGTGIHTSVIVLVNKALKGDVEKDRVTVTFSGGEIDGIGLWLSNMPWFEIGDSAVLFLNKIPPEEVPAANGLAEKLTGEQYAVFGGYQGKFSIIDGKVGTLAIDEFEDMVGQIVNGRILSIGDAPVTSDGIVVPYSFSGNSWPHPPAPNVHYRINENTADATGEGLAVQAAAATWNAAGASFSFTYDGATSATGFSANGVNEIMWGSLSAGTLAVTCIWYNPANSQIFETDMEFNDNYNWSTAAVPPPDFYDVQTIALHEFGHFLMLNDLYNAADADKVMCGYGVAGSTKRTLHPDDIAGIRDIYGTAVTAPEVTNGNAANLTPESATLYGEVTSTGGENPTARIYWGTSDGGVASDNWTGDANLGKVSAGVFFTDISGLTAGTTYYYRSYVINSAGDNWAPATANFTTPVSLTMAVNGSGDTTPEPGTYNYDPGSIVDITAAPAANWAFLNWEGGVADNTSAGTSIIMSGSKIVTANFIRTHGTLTLDIAGSGNITPLEGSHTYPVNTAFNLVAVPAAGWRFDNWTGDIATLGNAGSANTTIFINGDYHITANFSRPTLTLVVNGGGSVSPGAGSHPYDIGSNVTITAVPAANWVFLDWSGAVSGNSTSANVTMDDDKTVNANFLRTHGNLTIKFSGSGTVYPATGTYTYIAGEDVNIGARPAAGWQFVQWSGDTATVSNIYSGNTTVKMDGDYNITATFTSIGASAVGGGGGGGGGGSGILPDDKTLTGLLTLTDDNGFMYDNVEATSFDALATLDIPYGTTVRNKSGGMLTVISIINVREPDAPQDEMALIGNVYDFQPSGATFDPPIPLHIYYYEKNFPEGVTEDMLCIVTWNEEIQSYEPLDFTIDTEKNTITTYIGHFSRYTIVAAPKPASFSLSGLTVTPENVNLYDEVNVSVTVTNTGHLSGEYTAAAIVKGVALNPRTVTLNGKEQITLHFTVKALYEGVNEVSVGDLKGSFNVTLTPPDFKMESLSVSSREVEIGQRVDIRAIVANSGQSSGAYEASFMVNGAVMETREVIIGGESSREIRFSYTANTTGRTKVQVNNLLNSFIAIAPPPPQPGPPPTDTAPAVDQVASKTEDVSLADNLGVILGVCAGFMVTGTVLYFTWWRKRMKTGR